MTFLYVTYNSKGNRPGATCTCVLLGLYIKRHLHRNSSINGKPANKSTCLLHSLSTRSSKKRKASQCQAQLNRVMPMIVQCLARVVGLHHNQNTTACANYASLPQ